MRILHLNDVHDALEGEFVEIEAVAHVIVCRHRLGIIVYHYGAIACLAYGVESLHATPVKLY